jgi:hypothetical protein
VNYHVLTQKTNNNDFPNEGAFPMENNVRGIDA